MEQFIDTLAIRRKISYTVSHSRPEMGQMIESCLGPDLSCTFINCCYSLFRKNSGFHLSIHSMVAFFGNVLRTLSKEMVRKSYAKKHGRSKYSLMGDPTTYEIDFEFILKKSATSYMKMFYHVYHLKSPRELEYVRILEEITGKSLNVFHGWKTFMRTNEDVFKAIFVMYPKAFEACRSIVETLSANIYSLYMISFYFLRENDVYREIELVKFSEIIDGTKRFSEESELETYLDGIGASEPVRFANAQVKIGVLFFKIRGIIDEYVRKFSKRDFKKLLESSSLCTLPDVHYDPIKMGFNCFSPNPDLLSMITFGAFIQSNEALKALKGNESDLLIARQPKVLTNLLIEI